MAEKQLLRIPHFRHPWRSLLFNAVMFSSAMGYGLLSLRAAVIARRAALPGRGARAPAARPYCRGARQASVQLGDTCLSTNFSATGVGAQTGIVAGAVLRLGVGAARPDCHQ